MTSLAESGTSVVIDGQEIAVTLPDGRVFDYCKRCGGSGHYSFNPSDGTRCFGCNGSGLGKLTTVADATKRAMARQRAARKRRLAEEARLFEQEQERQAWAEHNRSTSSHLARIYREFNEADEDDKRFHGQGLLIDLAAQAAWRPLSPAQTSLAERLIVDYKERTAKIASQKASQEAAGHFGSPGEKFEIDVEIVFTKFIEGSFNGRPIYSTLVIMKTADGHTLKTFSSGEFGNTAEKGQQIRIKGTVKAHEERDGLPETSVTRIKLA